MRQAATRLRTVSPGEVIFSEGFVGVPAMYVIKDGQVEISVHRNDTKIVLSTLGKGQFFGESVLVSSGPRNCTAKALSYCELQVVEPSALQGVIDGAPAILRHMLRSLIVSCTKKDELLVTHENMQAQPDIVSYSQILRLMAAAAAAEHGIWSRDRDRTATLEISDAVKRCREITGHSRHHVGATLKRMAVLNLISLENVSANLTGSELSTAGGILRFDQNSIGARAQELAKHNLEDQLHAEQELMDLVELESLIGVSRSLLLRKLAHAEIAEDIFSFRRSEVLRFVSEKGKNYFAKRQHNGEMQSVDDLLEVDKRVLFEALSSVDDFDLAKLFQSIDDPAVRERLFSCMAKAKRSEIEKLMKEGVECEAEEAGHIEQALLEAVKALRRPVNRLETYGTEDGLAG